MNDTPMQHNDQIDRHDEDGETASTQQGATVKRDTEPHGQGHITQQIDENGFVKLPASRPSGGFADDESIGVQGEPLAKSVVVGQENLADREEKISPFDQPTEAVHEMNRELEQEEREKEVVRAGEAEQLEKADQESAQRRFAVITGASSGIGLELARKFSRHGFDLLISSSGDGIEQTAGYLRTGGGKVEAVAADLSTYEGVEDLCKRIFAGGRPVDALCINAGVGVGGAFTETRLEDELKMLNLNVVGTVHLAKRIIAQMVDRNEGRVLITSSVAAVMPSPFEAVYGASKAFQLLFAEALAAELKDTNVTVTAVLPGPTDTNFFHRAQMDDTKIGQEPKDDPADVAERAYNAMMAGKQKAFVGNFKTRVLGMLAELMPDSLAGEMHRKLSEPGPEAKASVR